MDVELVDGELYLVKNDQIPQVGQYNKRKEYIEYVTNWNDGKSASKAEVIPIDLATRAAELQADNERLRQDRADVLNVKSRDGLLSSEWLLRTAHAERRVDELQAENERLREALELAEEWLDDVCMPGSEIASRDGMDARDKILAALSAAKGDE